MTFEEAMGWQAAFCDKNGAPITARICLALAKALDRTSVTGRRVLDWPGDWVADAMPLRLVAPFHALHRRGDLPVVDSVHALKAAVTKHDDWIAAWLDGPPQTNEPGRSAAFVAALHMLAEQYPGPVDLLEIGSSAGLNLLINRYAYDLGGVRSGPEDAPVAITPEWRGPPPPAKPIDIASVRGVDIAPIDVRDPDAAERLLAYVWIDVPERSARVEAAIEMIRKRAVDLVQADAADWIEARLAEPTPHGRVLMHSVVWPYLDGERQARIIAAIARAGAEATAERPLAWIRYEWGTSSRVRHQVRMTVWPGGEDKLLGEGHPHGAWFKWGQDS